MPLPSDELAKLGLGQFPIVIGGVVAAVNIDGVGPGELKLTGPAARRHLPRQGRRPGPIPAIKALNPDLKLPDAKIAVVHRSDGSGTTFNFTDYLSKVSPEWKREGRLRPAACTGRPAPAPRATRASRRRCSADQEFDRLCRVRAGARRRKLSYALIQNRAGAVRRARTPTSFQAAAASADWAQAGDFDLLLTDAPGEDAYPIVATVFALMHKHAPPRPHAGRARLSSDGRSTRARTTPPTLGYVPLPAALVKQVKAYWTMNFKGAAS